MARRGRKRNPPAPFVRTAGRNQSEAGGRRPAVVRISPSCQQSPPRGRRPLPEWGPPDWTLTDWLTDWARRRAPEGRSAAFPPEQLRPPSRQRGPGATLRRRRRRHRPWGERSGAERSGRGRRPAAGRSGEPSRAGVSRPGSHGRGGGGEVNRAQALASRWLRGAERGPSVRGGAETRWYPRPAPSLLPSLRPGPSRCLRSTARAASPSPPPPPPLPLLRPAGTRAGAAGDGRSGPVDEQRPEGQVTVWGGREGGGRGGTAA